MIDFSNKLSEILHIKGISKRELARRTGITEQSICRYTNGSRIPKATEIVLIAKELNVNTDELLGVKKNEISLSDVLLKLSILANDTELSINECLEYYKVKIIIERLVKELSEKAKANN